MKSLGITNFVTVIPLPGNSLGVSEAIFDNFLESFENSDINPVGAGVVLYFSYRVQMTFLSLVGLPFFILHKRIPKWEGN